jgi:hypothetical protein
LHQLRKTKEKESKRERVRNNDCKCREEEAAEEEEPFVGCAPIHQEQLRRQLSRKDEQITLRRNDKEARKKP